MAGGLTAAEDDPAVNDKSGAKAGRLTAAEDGRRVHDNSGGLTANVVVICLTAASCGLIFGYDIGVAGGVTQMESFLSKFFPEVLRGIKVAKHDPYCKYDNHLLSSFTSSLYIASTLASLVASHVTRRIGRQAIMLIGGVSFVAGSVIMAAAVHVAMLIVGRMLLGVGVGFTNQAAPLYLAETSPARWRGGFTMAYQFFISAGTVAANVVNYFTTGIPGWGWRVSLGAAGVPAILVVVGALLVPDTPSSLVVRGEPDKARASLQHIRGADADVDAEFKDMVRAVEDARRSEEGALKRLLRSRAYRPSAVMMVAIPIFYEFTGMIVIYVFAPVLFRTLGFDSRRALLGSIIINLVATVAVVPSSFVVDRLGRRFLFLAGGVAMMVLQVAVAWILAGHLSRHGTATMAKGYAEVVLVLMGLYTFSLGVSLGPVKWVTWSELHPVDTRSLGQAISLAVALLIAFLQTQVFTAMLCTFKYGIFLFFAAWVLAMVAFVAAFLPETKGVPLEAMRAVWARHWYWKRFVGGPAGT